MIWSPLYKSARLFLMKRPKFCRVHQTSNVFEISFRQACKKKREKTKERRRTFKKTARVVVVYL